MMSNTTKKNIKNDSNEYRPDTYHMDFSKYHTNKARVVKKIKLSL